MQNKKRIGVLIFAVLILGTFLAGCRAGQGCPTFEFKNIEVQQSDVFNG